MLIVIDSDIKQVVMFDYEVKRCQNRNLVGAFLMVELNGNIIKSLQFIFKDVLNEISRLSLK